MNWLGILFLLLTTQTKVLYTTAQEASATIILGVTDDSDGSDPVGELQAQAIGTGQDGTTFVVEALPTDPTEDTLTATIVEAATRVSVHMAGASESLSVQDDVVCDLNPTDLGASITCTEILAGNDDSTILFGTTMLETGPATITIVPITTPAPSPTTSDEKQSNGCIPSTRLNIFILLVLVLLHTFLNVACR